MDCNSISLNAYAKINLYLDITGRRHDGYHLLETVMHSVSLRDIVTMKKTEKDITVICSDKNIPCDDRNIAYKCAAAFFEKTCIENAGVSITIQKNIPSQAGLGGGSTDGAAVLKGMNALFDFPLSDNELLELGGQIGADIPFCIKGGCGFCTGIGEIIAPLPSLEGIVVIGKGSTGISTAQAYADIDRTEKRIGLEGVFEFFGKKPNISEISPYCGNIFEDVCGIDEVFAIKKIMEKNGCAVSHMTGSGSAVFGIFEDISRAEAAESEIKKHGFYADICRLTQCEQTVNLFRKDMII